MDEILTASWRRRREQQLSRALAELTAEEHFRIYHATMRRIGTMRSGWLRFWWARVSDKLLAWWYVVAWRIAEALLRCELLPASVAMPPEPEPEPGAPDLAAFEALL